MSGECDILMNDKGDVIGYVVPYFDGVLGIHLSGNENAEVKVFKNDENKAGCSNDR